MKAPQFGHSKGKKRGSQSPKIAYGRALARLATPLPRVALFHAIGLRGANVAPPDTHITYNPPNHAQYEDGTTGAPCKLYLHHKSANWDNGVIVSGQGPIVTKRYTVVKNRRSKARRYKIPG
jgi:hypothetical protein